jgi:hypothetical protein
MSWRVSKVDKVDQKPYSLLSNNCGDFVHDAVNALGWKNVPRSTLPDPYVQELYIANVAEFRAANDSVILKRTGDKSWQWSMNGQSTTLEESKHDSTWFYLSGPIVLSSTVKSELDLKVPVKGGVMHKRLLFITNWGPDVAVTAVTD